MTTRVFITHDQPRGRRFHVTDRAVWDERELLCDAAVENGLFKFQRNVRAVQVWLEEAYNAIGQGLKPQVPDHIMEILCPVEHAQRRAVKQREPKASVAHSSAQSPKD